MEIVDILKYAVALISTLIVVAVLLQTRSGGIGSVFGGTGGGDLYKTRRGFEAVLYNSTIALGIMFGVFSFGIAVLSV